MRDTRTRKSVPLAASALALVLAGVATPVPAGTLLPAASAAVEDRADSDEDDEDDEDYGKHDGGKEDNLELVVDFVDPGLYGPADLEGEHPVVHVRAVLPSRGIHVFRPTQAATVEDRRKLERLAKKIATSPQVDFAEADSAMALSDSRYHSWPNGTPRDVGDDPDRFHGQPLVRRLALPESRRLSTGDGVTVAVLDTGSWPHAELDGRLTGGYDYVADDADPTEERQQLDDNDNGVVDEAYGHGTFVAGLISLVAPEASIMPMRVLDSDGAGSVFLVAQAIVDAVDAGADVVNVSLGTPEKIKSKLLDAALDHAMSHQVRVVAAAGNASSSQAEYPATQTGVLSVTSTLLEQDRLAAHANWGAWVDVAAPGEDLVGPVPGSGYATWAGTSMAAPQVSGQLALLIAVTQDERDEDEDPLVDAVTSTTRPVAGRRVQHGAVDLPASLRSWRRPDD